MTTLNNTLNGIATSQERKKIEVLFYEYLEHRRRQLLGELRDIEKHLLEAGRITQPSLMPRRER